VGGGLGFDEDLYVSEMDIAAARLRLPARRDRHGRIARADLLGADVDAKVVCEISTQPRDSREASHIGFVFRHRQRTGDLTQPLLHRARRVEPPLVAEVAKQRREHDRDVDGSV